MSDGEAETTRSQTALSLTDRELFDRLGWFTQIRWALGLFCLLVLLVSWHVFGVRFLGFGPEPTELPAVGVVLVMFLYNAAFVFVVHVVHAHGRITHRLLVFLALLQVLCDMVAICALIHYTGGVENFFIVLIFVPLAIAPALLPQAFAYLAAAVAAGLINVLAWGEQQGVLPHVQVLRGPGESAAASGLYTDPIFVLQATTAMTATIFALVSVASAIAARLRRGEAELENAYGRLRAVDEAKGFFMRRAGHEMRAPLAAIHSILDAISEPQSLQGDPRPLIDRARKRTKAMISLVSDLRRYSRLRSLEGVLPLQPVQLGVLVTAAAELFRTQASTAGIELSCQVEETTVAGDEELLRELMTNLVANAIQYTPSGGRVELQLRRQGEDAVVSVADTGIGISAEAAKHLFQEFYRSPEAKNVFLEGTGMGLAISKRIAEMHGGRIEAAPRPEGGAKFTVYLPLHLARRG